MSIKVAVFVGSLREGSSTKAIADNIVSMLPENYSVQYIEIGDLPHYDPFYEDELPDSWVRFREEVGSSDAALFFTPEYNRSFPGFLKNAIDIGSRPFGSGALSGKPAGVVSVSYGALGGFGANQHLRQVLVCLDMPVLAQPEMYISNAPTLLDQDEKVSNVETLAFFKTFVDAFTEHVERNIREDEATA